MQVVTIKGCDGLIEMVWLGGALVTLNDLLQAEYLERTVMFRKAWQVLLEHQSW